MSNTNNQTPLALEVESGKTYYLCSCGKSSNPPFCDGSHQESDDGPVQYEAKESTTVYFCRCGRSKTGVMCDGSHNS